MTTSFNRKNIQAIFNFQSDMSSGYTEGYLRAACILSSYVKEHPHEVDFLIYPTVFLYRHHLEILMKDICRQRVATSISLSNTPALTHNLNVLFEQVKTIAKDIYDIDDLSVVDGFDSIVSAVEFISTHDRDSTGFRYSYSKNGGKSLSELRQLNFNEIIDMLTNACDFLSNIDCCLQYNYQW